MYNNNNNKKWARRATRANRKKTTPNPTPKKNPKDSKTLSFASYERSSPLRLLLLPLIMLFALRRSAVSTGSLLVSLFLLLLLLRLPHRIFSEKSNARAIFSFSSSFPLVWLFRPSRRSASEWDFFATRCDIFFRPETTTTKKKKKKKKKKKTTKTMRSRKVSSIVFVPPRSRPTRRQNADARLKWVNARMATFVYLKDTHFTNFRCASREIQSPAKKKKKKKFLPRAVSGREFPKYFAVIRASLLFTVGWCVRVSPKRARFNLFIYFDVWIFRRVNI